MKIEGSSMKTKFLPWMVVTLTKIGNTREADLGGVDDNYIFGSMSMSQITSNTGVIF